MKRKISRRQSDSYSRMKVVVDDFQEKYYTYKV